MIKVFLSGSVQKHFQELNVGKKYWGENEEVQLRNKIQFEVEFLNPNTITLDKKDREGRFRKDLEMVLESDMVLVDATDKKGIGIGAEMALAKAWRIPVYTIAPIGSHYRKLYENGEEWIHPFIYELSDRVFNDLDEFIVYINDLISNNLIQAKINNNPRAILDKFDGFDGGYDEGYRFVESFWGNKPAHLVQECAILLKNDASNEISCLDLGCGHGKNAIFMMKQGFIVDAWDSSYFAIQEARKLCTDINWKVRDIRKIYPYGKKYDAILMTGCLHCLTSKSEIERVIRIAQNITKIGGYHVISAFNSNVQDLSGHANSFKPTLLSHEEYKCMYQGWDLLSISDTIQEDVHKHNSIMHKHSITRILARKNGKG